MADRRAMLTDREREIVSGEADVADEYRYQTVSRVRNRFNRLKKDMQAMREHGQLAEDFLEKVEEATKND